MALSKKAGNSKDLKVLNRIAVLNTIRNKGPIARHEVSKIIGLTPPAVTVIVNSLIAAGIIREIGRGDSTGGRRPVMLELNPRAGYILALRIQRGEIVSALLDLGHHIIETQRQKIDTGDPEEVVAVIGDTFAEMMHHAHISHQNILWCGVASPGLVNSYEGIVERSSNLSWGKVAFAEMLSRCLKGIPVHVENISNAAALGEKMYGSGYHCSDMIYLNLSVGIGAGIIINNQLFGGSQGYAGEIGLAIVPYPAKDNLGFEYCTLESICGIQAVLQRIRAVIPEASVKKYGLVKSRISSEEILTPSLMEIAEVRNVLAEAGRMIGIKVAELIQLFNPKMIILGGEWAGAGEFLLEIVREEVRKNTLKEMSESVKLIVSTMREDPPLMGVYALVLEKVFQTEEWIGNESNNNGDEENVHTK